MAHTNGQPLKPLETEWRRTIAEDIQNEGAWDKLETPKDWHEPMFVPTPTEYEIPLWVTILAACGLWGVGYYLVVLGLYLWGVI